MRDPIWEILKEQGRNMSWLSRQIDVPHSYVRKIACKRAPATPEFRRRCARAMSLPERVLFLPREFEGRKTTPMVEVAS